MVDRINNAGITHSRRVDTSRSEKSNGGSETSSIATADAPKNNVDTAETSLVNRTREQIDASDGVDRQKVEAIKTAIRNGEFAIDAKAVAKAFVDLEMSVGI